MRSISIEKMMSVEPEYRSGYSFLGNYDVIIVEGFEMVGKSTLIKKLISNIRERQPNTHVSTYRPDYGVLDTQLERSDRHIPGLVALDVFKVTKRDGDILILDRSFLSSLAYGEIYDGKESSDLSSLKSAYLDTLEDLNVLVLVVGVDSKLELEMRYELSLKYRGEVDKYDVFDSFEDYYRSYQEFTDYFKGVGRSLRSSGVGSIDSYYFNNTSDDLSVDLENFLVGTYDPNIDWTTVVSKLSSIADEVRSWRSNPIGKDKSSDYSRLIRILKLLRSE